MEWTFWIGLLMLGLGGWFWRRKDSTSSPLFLDEALWDIHRALKEIKDTLVINSSDPILKNAVSNQILISYICQMQMLQNRTFIIHNISMTIPAQNHDALKWNTETQHSLLQFICNTLSIPKVHGAHISSTGILSMNVVFTNEDEHTQYINAPIQELEILDPLLEPKHKITILPLPTELEPQDSSKHS